MRKHISDAEARELKPGTLLYNNVIVFTEKDGTQTPATAKVTGKARPHPIEGFILPIKRMYGDGKAGSVSRFSTVHWRLTAELEEEEPSAPLARRVRRSAPVPTPESEQSYTGHVRRVRRQV